MFRNKAEVMFADSKGKLIPGFRSKHFSWRWCHVSLWLGFYLTGYKYNLAFSHSSIQTEPESILSIFWCYWRDQWKVLWTRELLALIPSLNFSLCSMAEWQTLIFSASLIIKTQLVIRFGFTCTQNTYKAISFL